MNTKETDIHLAAQECDRKTQKPNWVRTNEGDGWFVLFRLYGPARADYDRSWKPNDFKRVE